MQFRNIYIPWRTLKNKAQSKEGQRMQTVHVDRHLKICGKSKT